MLSPNAPPISQLVRECGVSKSVLYSWRANAVSKGGMGTKNKSGRRREAFSAAQKFELLTRAAGLSQDELGAFLREHGIHEADLQRWREKATQALQMPLAAKASAQGEVKKIRALERELLRKDKALAEASALLILKKKAQAIWGDEDDTLPKRSGR
jgi:hypothetical protein